MNEISKVIKYYLMETQKGKNSPRLMVKFEKTFLKYFADQMRDNFPGRRMRFGGGGGGGISTGTTVDLSWPATDLIWTTDNTATQTFDVNTSDATTTDLFAYRRGIDLGSG